MVRQRDTLRTALATAERERDEARAQAVEMTNEEFASHRLKLGLEISNLRAENERLAKERDEARADYETVCNYVEPLQDLSGCYDANAVGKIIEEQVGDLRSQLTARDATVLRLRRAMEDARARCEWYGPNGTEQERHHFVAVELVHDFNEALDAADSGALSRVLGEVASVLTGLKARADWLLSSHVCAEGHDETCGDRKALRHYIDESEKALAKLKPWLASGKGGACD